VTTVAVDRAPIPPVRLGLRNNLSQFLLLVVVNAFVGAMVGLERAILPALAEQVFHLVARTAILSFIVVFGATKAFTNYLAGRWSDTIGRKYVLVIGWLVALPVPWLLMWSPSWSWILFANALLGISQGLTWSTTVIMKIDLVGPRQRGLAMGVNEFAGYAAVGLSALATGYLAGRYAVRPQPFYPGVIYAVAGLMLSVLFVRDTQAHARHETQTLTTHADGSHAPSQRAIFLRTSFTDRKLSTISQAGFVNNLNDGAAWGLFPIVYAAAGLGLNRIGILAAVYPSVWGVTQLFTGALSDRIGRKWLIACGMWLQAFSVAAVVFVHDFTGYVLSAIMFGLGTAMVYPTLLASIGDVAHASWRASAVGVYRLWRDLGYAAGAVIAGLVADLLGLRVAVVLIAAITLASGVVVAVRFRESHSRVASGTVQARAVAKSTSVR
jgi:MFS family permease